MLRNKKTEQDFYDYFKYLIWQDQDEILEILNRLRGI